MIVWCWVWSGGGGGDCMMRENQWQSVLVTWGETLRKLLSCSNHPAATPPPLHHQHSHEWYLSHDLISILMFQTIFTFNTLKAHYSIICFDLKIFQFCQIIDCHDDEVIKVSFSWSAQPCILTVISNCVQQYLVSSYKYFQLDDNW